MSKRLQVLLEDSELDEIQRIAVRSGLSVSEWVCDALRRARRQEASGDVGRKLQAVRVAAGHSLPTADPEQMLSDIERGYLPE